MNGKRQVKRKIGQVVQVRAGLPFDLNVMLERLLNLSILDFLLFVACRLRL